MKKFLIFILILAIAAGIVLAVVAGPGYSLKKQFDKATQFSFEARFSVSTKNASETLAYMEGKATGRCFDERWSISVCSNDDAKLVDCFIDGEKLCWNVRPAIDYAVNKYFNSMPLNPEDMSKMLDSIGAEQVIVDGEQFDYFVELFSKTIGSDVAFLSDALNEYIDTLQALKSSRFKPASKPDELELAEELKSARFYTAKDLEGVTIGVVGRPSDKGTVYIIIDSALMHLEVLADYSITKDAQPIGMPDSFISEKAFDKIQAILEFMSRLG